MIRFTSIWAIGFSAVLANGASLPTVLDRVGQKVESFWNYFPAVTCTEDLTQAKVDGKGKVLFDQRALYDYLVLLQASGDQVWVEESRAEKRGKERKGKASLLTSDGFSMLLMIFHPRYQSSFEFSEMEDDALDGRQVLRVGFRQLPGERAPTILSLRELEFPVLWKGTAWIDPSSFEVVRIEASLEAPMAELGLLQLSSDVIYRDVPFAGGPAMRLPVRAVIEAATKRQHWKNTHVFAGYRRFNVETEVRTDLPR